MRVGSLFTGHGQFDYGLTLAGLEHAWFCESDPWRREILALRWPGVPIFDDVRAVDGTAPSVDLCVGGFPCRGASSAGDREGMGNPETALWREMARVIRQLRPRLVLLENVANLLAVQRGRAWGEVLGDLAEIGYVCGWDCLPAAAFGAPHLRDRVFAIAAHTDGTDEGGRGGFGQEQNGRSDACRGFAPDARFSGRQERHRTEPSPPQIATADPHPPTHPGQGRRREKQRDLRRGQSDPTGLRPYSAAIERWEEIAGPAPEPLLRGVDARPARRVVRSRLSALGDGVQVQVGRYLGERILDFERGGVK